MKTQSLQAGWARNHLGFSIIELLMVLAVIGLAVGLFILNIDNAIEGVTRESPGEVMLKSFRKARLMAVTEKQTVFLSYNSELDRFELRTGNRNSSEVVASYDLDEADKESMDSVNFWPIEPFTEQSTRRQYEVFEHLPLPLMAVQFEPSGISNFIAVELGYAPSISEPVWLLMDPFSSAEINAEVR